MLAPLGALLLTLATSAHAAYDVVWDFRGQVPGSWNTAGWTQAEVQATEFGLRLQTTRDGGMRRRTDLTHPVHAVTVRIASARDTEAVLSWRVEGPNGPEYVQMPFVIPQASAPQPVEMDVSFYDQWDPMTTEIGLELPAGSDMLLQEIRLTGWTAQERMWESVKSFWRFDAFRPYSINFLWGPLIASNPVGAAHMFDTLPARGMSAVRFFYFAIVAGGAISLGLLLAKQRSLWLLALPVAFAASWLVFDLRMGAEILHYAYRDLRDETFRTHGMFYDVVEDALPDLMRHPRYAFVDDPRSPFYSNMRYMTYPSLPIRSTTASGVGLWFVYGRPDVLVDEQGRLILASEGNGEVLASSGRVLRAFFDDTFLYETAR